MTVGGQHGRGAVCRVAWRETFGRRNAGDPWLCAGMCTMLGEPGHHACACDPPPGAAPLCFRFGVFSVTFSVLLNGRKGRVAMKGKGAGSLTSIQDCRTKSSVHVQGDGVGAGGSAPGGAALPAAAHRETAGLWVESEAGDGLGEIIGAGKARRVVRGGVHWLARLPSGMMKEQECTGAGQQRGGCSVVGLRDQLVREQCTRFKVGRAGRKGRPTARPPEGAELPAGQGRAGMPGGNSG